MKSITTLRKELEQLWRNHFPKIPIPTPQFHYTRVSPFWAHLYYFLSISLLGFLALKASKPRTSNYTLTDLDLFFTSVSATTVSSMFVIEMELFSNYQLIVLTILMFLGGEIFTSMINLHLSLYNNSLHNTSSIESATMAENRNPAIDTQAQQQTIELNMVSITCPPESDSSDEPTTFFAGGRDEVNLKQRSIKSLGYVVLTYLLVVQVIGSCLVSTYISLISGARDLLEGKGLVLGTFSIFTVVSTFTNCGFIPTNEGMIVFRNFSGILIILLPFIFLGNTLYPACLRLVIWVLERFTERKEYSYILENYKELGYDHLMSVKESWFLAGSVFGLWMIQFVLFCVMEWRSTIMEGMSSFQKLVGSLFQVANSRHAGESIVDLSLVSPAILVLFVFMMYLPSYTSFLPIGDERQEAPEKSEGKKKQKNKKIENMLLSQLAYLTIFVIVICITERKSLKEDPLNFNVLNIVVEVVSAYGNVGFSTGYSCSRRLNLDEVCEDKWYGLSGRWSREGKVVLIIVMLFGRLKTFSKHAGKPWKLY